MTIPATTPAPQKITPDCQPVFPCWLWAVKGVHAGHWIKHRDFPWEPNHFTHWLPDQPTATTCTPTEGEKHETVEERAAKFFLSREPTHSAQEAAERAAAEIDLMSYFHDYCTLGDDYIRAIEEKLRARVTRHFPSTPTQSQQPPLSPGSGEAMREEIREAIESGLEASEIVESNETVSEIATNILKRLTPFLAQPATPPLSEELEALRVQLEQAKRNVRLWELNCMAAENKYAFAVANGVATPPLTSGEDTVDKVERIIAEGIANGDHPKTIAMKLVSPASQREELRALTPQGIMDWAKFSEKSLTKDPRKIRSAPPLPSIGDGKDGERERLRGLWRAYKQALADYQDSQSQVDNSEKSGHEPNYEANQENFKRLEAAEVAIDAAMSAQSGREEKP